MSVKKAIDALRKAENILMIFGMVFSVLIIFAQVICRRFLGFAFPWVEELARYLFIYFTWIGTSAAISTNQHIRLEVLSTLKPNLDRWLEPLISLICFAMAAFMFFNGITLLQTMAEHSAESPTLKLPMWIFYLAVPLGGALMMIKYGYKLWAEDIRALRKKEA